MTINSWPEEIEIIYQAWIGKTKHFGDIDADTRFYKFVWKCIDQPAHAPGASVLEERVKQDLKDYDFKYRKETSQNAASLYYVLHDFARTEHQTHDQ